MKAGIYGGVSAELYHADPAEAPSLSHSIAHVLLTKSAQAAWRQHPRLNPYWVRRRRKQFDLPTAIHALFLEGEDVMVHVETKPDVNGVHKFSTKAQKVARDEAYAEGLIPVGSAQRQEVFMAADRLKRAVAQLDDPRVPFSLGLPEQTLLWQEPNGVWCRARPDWLHQDHRCMDDLKIVGSSHPGTGPGQFGRSVFQLGHDIQAAFYLRGLRALTGQDALFRFVAFEVEGPEYTLTQLSPAGMALAEAKVDRAIGLWGACLESDQWPGYPKHAVLIEPPAYEMAQWDVAVHEEGF